MQSFKFLLIPPDTDAVSIKKLKAKPILRNNPLLIVTQFWSTSDDPPNLPDVSDHPDGPYTDVFGWLRVPSTSIRICPEQHSQELREAFLASIAGERAGKSKEKCLLSLLSTALAENPSVLPDDARLDYPPRSGYVEFDDGVALFVNMPSTSTSSRAGQRYPNEWLDDGQVLTWFVRDNEWSHGTSPLAKKLLDPESSNVLFVRVTDKNYFLCCGPCIIVPETDTAAQEGWRLVQLNIRLLEWGKLQTSTDFLSLLS